MRRSVVVMMSACVLLLGNALAEDRVDLEATQIIGSRELPKVLYIVPWKEPLPTDLVGRPTQSLLDEALAPLDRDVFRREVLYHALLQGVERKAPPDAGLPQANK